MTLARLLVLLLAAMLLAASARAQTLYYVRTTGNNSSNGLTPQTAWRTIDRAADLVTSGAIVYVGAGTYNEAVTPNNDGTAAAPIRFIADTTGAHTGDAGVVLIRRMGDNILTLDSDNHIWFTGFRFETNKTAIDVIGSTGIRIENATITAGDGEGVRVVNNSSVTIERTVITASDGDGIRSEGGTITINDSTIQDCENAAIVATNSNAIVRANRVRIRDCSFGLRAESGQIFVVNGLIHSINEHGGVAQNSSARLDLRHCTIDTISGHAIVTEGGRIDLFNSIITNTSGHAIHRTNSATVNKSHNLYFANAAGRFGGSTPVTMGTGEISASPAYIVGEDYRLAANSPAVNAGTTLSPAITNDFLNGPRPFGNPDMGCYERNTAVAAAIPYTNTFESGTAGAEWSSSQVDTSQAYFSRFLGRAGNTANALTLTTQAGVSYTLAFDLYAFDSWDGSHAQHGPDTFTVRRDGEILLRETIATFVTDSSFPFTFPDLPDEWGVNRGGNASWPDTIFRGITLTFTATSSQTVLTFGAENLEALDNESWGIDNVRVVLASAAATVTPRFVEVGRSRNFNFPSSNVSTAAPAIVWGDLDDDGDLDAVTTGESNAWHVVNSNGLSFARTALPTRLSRQVALLDIDNNGTLDVWGTPQSDGNGEILLLNTAGALSNAGARGFTGPANNEAVAAADLNRDGWCDIAMFTGSSGNHAGINAAATPIAIVGDNTSAIFPQGAADSGNGDNCSSADINNDGYPDFFYHFNGGRLFTSDGAGGYVSDSRGISVYTDNNSKMGSAWGDYNNDGHLDLFVGRRVGGRGYLWQNPGPTGNFVDVAASAGLTAQNVVGCAWGDLDNDGDLDLYVTLADGLTILYRNNGPPNWTFTADSQGATTNHRGGDVALADIDGDGDLDIAITSEATTFGSRLWLNRTNSPNYLLVRPIGLGAGATNRAAIGTRIELWNAAGTTLLARRDIGGASGFGGQAPLWAHFGGINPALTYQVRVHFLRGTQTVNVVPAAASTAFPFRTIPQMLTVTEANTRPRVVRWVQVAPQ